MKKLKKFAALLLVGVMALALLTACGGGGGSSTNKAEEQKVMEQIGKEKGISVASDAELRAVAERHLKEQLNGAFQLGNHKFVGDVDVEGEKDDYLIITVTAKYTYSDTLLSSLLKTIESSTKVSNKVNANVKQNGTWSNVGVVVITDNEQSYIGLSIRVKNPKM